MVKKLKCCLIQATLIVEVASTGLPTLLVRLKFVFKVIFVMICYFPLSH